MTRPIHPSVPMRPLCRQCGAMFAPLVNGLCVKCAKAADLAAAAEALQDAMGVSWSGTDDPAGLMLEAAGEIRGLRVELEQYEDTLEMGGQRTVPSEELSQGPAYAAMLIDRMRTQLQAARDQLELIAPMIGAVVKERIEEQIDGLATIRTRENRRRAVDAYLAAVKEPTPRPQAPNADEVSP